MKGATYVLFGVLCLALAGCGGPVSASRVDPKVVQQDLARSAVTTGGPSWDSRNVLRERGLFDTYAERPEEALTALHRTMVGTRGDPDLLFALVAYSSAHIEPVESEYVVRPSDHSTQGNPKTIEEVRRILRLHVGVD